MDRLCEVGESSLNNEQYILVPAQSTMIPLSSHVGHLQSRLQSISNDDIRSICLGYCGQSSLGNCHIQSLYRKYIMTAIIATTKEAQMKCTIKPFRYSLDNTVMYVTRHIR